VLSLPEVPTFTELGYPGVVATVWSGLVAPAGTPQPILDKVNREIVAALKHPDSIQKLRATDQEPVGSTISEFTAFMKADRERWQAAVKASGFKATE
jgi:tripartite-type tricarboxylate transporter receptor subunit TctC